MYKFGEEFFQLREGTVFGQPGTHRSTVLKEIMLDELNRKMQIEALSDFILEVALGLDLKPAEAKEVEMYGFSDRRWLRSLGVEYPKEWE